jgi:hypothetical protein
MRRRPHVHGTSSTAPIWTRAKVTHGPVLYEWQPVGTNVCTECTLPPATARVEDCQRRRGTRAPRQFDAQPHTDQCREEWSRRRRIATRLKSTHHLGHEQRNMFGLHGMIVAAGESPRGQDVPLSLESNGLHGRCDRTQEKDLPLPAMYSRVCATDATIPKCQVLFMLAVLPVPGVLCFRDNEQEFMLLVATSPYRIV